MMVQRPYLLLYAIYPDANDEAVDTVEIVRVVDAAAICDGCSDIDLRSGGISFPCRTVCAKIAAQLP